MVLKQDPVLRLAIVGLISAVASVYMATLAAIYVFSATLWGPFLVGAAIVFSLAYYLFHGPALFLESVGARPIDAGEYPDLYSNLTIVAHQLGIETPSVAVVNDTEPNAAAVGTLFGPGVVVITEGLLDTLSTEQLRAVLAHEIAHIANGDGTVMTISAILPMSLTIPNDDGKGGGELTVLSLGGILLLPIAGVVQVLTMALNRRREFAADRAAAEIVGDVGIVIETLCQMSNESTRPTEDLRKLDAKMVVKTVPTQTDQHPSHPSVEERIERLQAVADG